jgi:hypothetical protein
MAAVRRGLITMVYAQRITKLASCAGLLSLVACTSTVQIPPTELPALARARHDAPRQWPTVITKQGQLQTVMGDIEQITLEGPKGRMPVYTPAWAAVDAERLFVTDPLGRRVFRLDDVSSVTVVYDDARKPRVAGGAILLGLATPIVIGSAAMLVVAAVDDDEYAVPGLIGFGIGAALGIPGLVLVLSNPSPPDRDEAALVRPTVAFGPGGVRFSTTF